MNPSFQHDSKKVSFFSLTQRIFLFDTMYDSKNKLIVFWKIWHIFFFLKKKKNAQNWTSLFSNMTHRIEHLFSRIWRTELNLFFNLTLRIESFFLNVTQRIGLVLKMTQRIAPFLKITQRIEPFSQCDSKIWTFSQSDSKNCFFFFNMTRRIEPSFSNMSQWIEPFCRSTQRIEPCFFQYDSKTWHLLKIWFSRIEPFENLTQRIELLKVWLKALNPFFQYESTNRTHFSNMTQRIDFFFEYDSKNLFFLNIDSKNWTLLNYHWRKELNLFSWIWRKDWSFSPKFWQKNQWIEPSFQKWFKELNMTQRIELFSMWLKEFNFWTLLQIWLTLRVQPIWTFSYDSTNWTYFTWLKELNLIELSLKELNLLFHDSKNWTFFFWRDSMNWIFSVIQRIVLSLLNVIQRIEPFLLNVTQRIESLLNNMKNWSFLQKWLRIEPFLNLFIWLEEMNIFRNDSKN